MSTKKAIDLFSGAGGFSLGLKMAGWDVKLAVEIDADAIHTHSLNMPDIPHICINVRNIDFSEFRNIDLIVGGPPCQPFSASGKQLGRDDSRDMIPQFIRAVKEVKPKAFIMENVPGLVSKKFKPYFDSKLKELSALGYNVNWKILNAADYGVPQNRLRLFVVGISHSIMNSSFEFPLPTHGPHSARMTPYISVGSIITEIPPDKPNHAKITYCKNPILRKSPYAGMLLNGQGRPINLNAPCPTITASAGGNRTHVVDINDELKKYHQHLMSGGESRSGLVSGCRRLTVRESARIQTFPDWFEFTGSQSKQYSQIGNAVPTLLAKIISESVLNLLTQK